MSGQQPSAKIAMTSPVTAEVGEGTYKISFIMPSEYTQQSLPRPLNDRVVIKVGKRGFNPCAAVSMALMLLPTTRNSELHHCRRCRPAPWPRCPGTDGALGVKQRWRHGVSSWRRC